MGDCFRVPTQIADWPSQAGSLRYGRPAVCATAALTAAEALAAVETLVAGAVANRDVAAVGTGRGVLLEMRDGIAQAFHDPLARGAVGVAMAVTIAGLQLHRVRVFRKRQLRNGTIYFFFHFLDQAGHGEFGLGAGGRAGFAAAG